MTTGLQTGRHTDIPIVMCERPLTRQSYRTTSHHYDVMIDKWIGVCLRLRVER